MRINFLYSVLLPVLYHYFRLIYKRNYSYRETNKANSTYERETSEIYFYQYVTEQVSFSCFYFYVLLFNKDSSNYNSKLSKLFTVIVK